MTTQEINQFNLNSGLLNKYKCLLYHNLYWHQVVVENVGDLDRDAVLRTLMKFCQPWHFIPVHYESRNNIATFLLKNCGGAIQKLCSNSLVIVNPFNKDKPFKITIKLCYASSNELKINIQINLTHILNKRFNQETGLLNLDNFAKDTDLEEYCALSQPKLFFYILHLAKNIQFKSLKLSNNDIESLQSMEALEGFKTPIAVDLRNNNVKDISEIENMKHLQITELWLDGNPICDNYTEITYGKAMKDRLTKLEKLDGINVQLTGFLPFRRNFLCNFSGYDLVDQFLEHFFTLYDTQNRAIMADLYHKEALFSVTSMYIPGQNTSSTANLAEYKKLSRNLKHISDFSKTGQGLFMGSHQIIQTLCSLPLTEHDPYSFTADLIMHTETTAVLTVTGVFRESSNSLLESERLMGFCRTFVLLGRPNGEYSIINDMLNVTNATSIQAVRAFKNVRITRPLHIIIPTPQNEKEKSEMAETLTVITGMKSEWSRKCLEERKYVFKDALNLFIDLFKQDKIPKPAFLSEEDMREITNRVKHTTQISNPGSLVGPQGNLKSKALPVKSSIETIQPVAKQQSLQPIVSIAKPLNLQRSAPSAIKTTSIQNQFQSGPLSPDRVWDTFVLNNDSTSHAEGIDPIEVNSSPDDVQSTHSNHEQGSDTNYNTGNEDTCEMREAMKSPPPNSLHLLSKLMRQKKKFQKYVMQSDFGAFQGLCQEGNFKTAISSGLEIIKKNPTKLTVFEMVFDWIYKTGLEHARQFTHKVYNLTNHMRPFLGVLQLDLIVARCEFLYGCEQTGESEFRKLIEKRPTWAHPITELCKALIQKGQVGKAKDVLRPFISSKHPLQSKMHRIARIIRKQYGVKLI
ncbi:hypothetical protein Trydic_g7489 [Trypoxylus dichotomus]